ncbi:U32 family peptidase [Vibrio chagasii]|nr:U32 family peptidase [Vibrio chagasii]
MPELVDAKVDSLKVEGRIKGAHYVYTVVDTWRKQIDSFVQEGLLLEDDSNLHHSIQYNEFTILSLKKGQLNEKTYSSITLVITLVNYAVEQAKRRTTKSQWFRFKKRQYSCMKRKDVLGDEMRDKIKFLDIRKTPVTMSFSAKAESSHLR